MPQRQFTIVELQRTEQGGFIETPFKFVWTAERQSGPRGPWEFETRVRTVRKDYPGADEPSEQILGTNYEPFQLQGIWDDKYNGQGFAVQTWQSFEQMTQRTPLVRVSFEQIYFTGVLTNFKISYFRANRIGWEFTMSPHFRLTPGDARRQRQTPPVVTYRPVDYSRQIRTLIDAALTAHGEAPRGQAAGDTIGQIGTALGAIVEKSDLIERAITGRMLTGSLGIAVNPVSVVAQAFAAMRIQTQALLNLTQAATVTGALAWDSGIGILAWESWVRGIAFLTRQLALQADLAARQLAAQAQGRPLAFYRPGQGESLYGISNRFYGTPHKWRDILDRNGLSVMVLTGAELLIIPAGI